MINIKPLFVFVLIVICILIWSMNQIAGLKREVLAGNIHTEVLNKEIAVLRAELASVKTELLVSNTATDREIMAARSITKLHEEITGKIRTRDVETKIVESPNLSASRVDDGMLKDTKDPQQESSGLVEGRREFIKLRYNNAIEEFASVDTSAADYIVARMGVANAYFYSRRYTRAISEFAYILEQQPGSVEAAVGLANAHHRLGQRVQQIAAYDKAISIEPQQWLHYNNRATAHLMDDNNEQAILDFQQAAKVAGPEKADQATALENIGLIHLRQQEWQLAYEHANDVNQLDAEHAWNWLIRGIAAAKLKRNVDAYVSFDNWFKYKRSTDPYLLKQLLPESIHAYIDVTPIGLTRLVDPPLISGQVCENDSQCKSYTCKPGPPFNKVNYCLAKDKDCSAPDSNGYLLNEVLDVEGISVRCYQPRAGNARWTKGNRVLD